MIEIEPTPDHSPEPPETDQAEVVKGLGQPIVRSLYGAPPEGYQPPELHGPTLDTSRPLS